jgi:uncharacterized protein (DUF1697 family)
MTRYIAFLRAINVGGHTVKMARLRELFEALGLGGVQTFIASGNVIFDAPDSQAADLEAAIEQHLQLALGYPVATFLRTPAEIATVAAYDAFPQFAGADETPSLYVTFFGGAPPAEAAVRLRALETEIDAFHLHGRELYWRCRTSIGASLVNGAQLERALGCPGTMRNITTVRRLAARYPA